MTEAQRKQFFAYARMRDSFVEKAKDNPSEINQHMLTLRPWDPAVYVVGDVRMYAGIPYKCVQVHDSGQNPTWTPDTTPALWMQYHGTTVDTARPWIAPAGAHDTYRAGEFMIWTDGAVYRCKQDTVYSPHDYAQAWERVD